MSDAERLPAFFRVRQTFPRPQLTSIAEVVQQQLNDVCTDDLRGRSVAVTVGSRGIANIAVITKACIDYLIRRGASPFIVPAMGSHGGATDEGQAGVLAGYGIHEASMGCPIRSSMQVEQIALAEEGFPVYFDRHALAADCVLVVNRIKPHTRFVGEIESGLMKMMLIGLGKQRGAEVYHRAIVNYSFDQIVRSVAKSVIQRCHILAGLAILENGFEETAQITAVAAADIERTEPQLLRQVKSWMPGLPFERAALLVVDQIGKHSDHAATEDEFPKIQHIYVRGLTEATHGNASGVGLAELCHRRVVDTIDHQITRMNCITAGHVTGAMLPIDFPSDESAISTACQLAGYMPADKVAAMWIRDTLSLHEVECSEVYFKQARSHATLEILSDPTPLEFDSRGDLVERFV
jgi:hypothetical protein